MTIEELEAENEQLRDELDALHMRYLSQVSLWKSRYSECLDRTCKYFLPLLKRIGCSNDGAQEILRKFKQAMEDKI